MASTAMALAESMLDPPPTPSTTSALCWLAILAPAVMVSVVGLGITPS